MIILQYPKSAYQSGGKYRSEVSDFAIENILRELQGEWLRVQLSPDYFTGAQLTERMANGVKVSGTPLFIRLTPQQEEMPVSEEYQVKLKDYLNLHLVHEAGNVYVLCATNTSFETTEEVYDWSQRGQLLTFKDVDALTINELSEI